MHITAVAEGKQEGHVMKKSETNRPDRRKFLEIAGLAAGGGIFALKYRNLSHVLAAQQQAPGNAPTEITDPVEVTGEESVPIVGRLPGARRMYMLPSGQGESYTIGGMVMTRVSRPAETNNVHEMVTFAGKSGASMPPHAHLGSHAALLVLGGEVELVLNGDTWTMMRGDFANIPPGTAHGWTMRSDKSKFALYTMNDRAIAGYIAMGVPASDSSVPETVVDIPAGKIARAPDFGDFQLRQSVSASPTPTRVSNKILPSTPGPYVLLDGGGDRFGGNTFLARNPNTDGQFLFLVTEGGNGGGVGPHFHARHFENFLGLDGVTMGWAHGMAVPVKSGDYFQAPPRNLHGFALAESYNRFAAFLSPGIFENFFVRSGSRPYTSAPAGGAPQPVGGADGAPPAGAAPGTPSSVAPPGVQRSTNNAMFRALMSSGKGPDGYPLDVHGPTQTLPPQDPFWIKLFGPPAQQAASVEQRTNLLLHGMAMCGMNMSREISPELKRALKLKPKAEDFV
jgi:quercetin 2,3-dioxygenase